MSKFQKAVMRLLTVGMLIASAACANAQQAYPTKPIRIIVPFPPGGSNDVVGRFLSQKLAESLGVQTVLENRGGGSGIIGAEALLKSAPDGYTIMVTSITTHIITPLLMPAPYDAVKDFAPVSTIDSSESIIVIHPSVPANNLQEFIALAKARPGKLNYGTSQAFGVVMTASFCMRAGISMQHIPYKGAGPVLTDLLGGQIQMFFSTPSSMVGYVRGGKIKALAVTGEARLPALPTVPTLTESGIPNFDMKGFRGVLAPPGTPKAIIDRLAAEINKILTMPDVREKLASQGMDPFISSTEQFAARMKADTARYAQVIKAADIKFDQ